MQEYVVFFTLPSAQEPIYQGFDDLIGIFKVSNPHFKWGFSISPSRAFPWLRLKAWFRDTILTVSLLIEALLSSIFEFIVFFLLFYIL